MALTQGIYRDQINSSAFSHWILILLGVVCYTLSFPSILYTDGVPLLAFIAITPIIYLSYNITLRESFWYSLWFGVLFSMLFAWWTKDYYLPALFGAAMITGVSFLPMIPLLYMISRRSSWAPLLHPFAWVAFEYLRIQGVFGNPFAVMGYSQFRSPEIIQIAQYTGVWGVYLLVLFPSSLLAGFFQRAGKVSAASLVVGLLLFCSTGGWLLMHSPVQSTNNQPMTEQLSVALIQHNPPLTSLEQEIEQLIALSEQALQESPDVIVWPETVVEFVLRNGLERDPEEQRIQEQIVAFQHSSRIPLLLGAFDTTDGTHLYNAALVMERGEIIDSWYKQKLVPFIEYSPISWLSPFHKKLESLGFGLLTPGRQYDPIMIPHAKKSLPVATPICFEESFGSLVSAQVAAGGEYLINMTNDSWASGEYAQWQHFDMGVYRAVEQQSYLVRVASSGVSGMISPNGLWDDSIIEPLTSGYIVVDLPKVSRSATLYRRWGDWFAWFCMGLVVVFLLSRKIASLCFSGK